jgi:hypothetical protein
MKNALTIGGATDALTKARSERAAAAGRIVQLEAQRSAQLETDDIAVDQIDQLDQAIAAERRAIAILDQRIAVIERDLARAARERREAERAAAIKIIAPELAKRTALAAELEASIKHIVALYTQIKNDQSLRSAWPFGSLNWQPYDLSADSMKSLRNHGYEMIPGNIRALIGHDTHGGEGFTQVPPSGPPGPRDLPGKIAAHGESILSSLRKADIHPPEPKAENDMEAV